MNTLLNGGIWIVIHSEKRDGENRPCVLLLKLFFFWLSAYHFVKRFRIFAVVFHGISFVLAANSLYRLIGFDQENEDHANIGVCRRNIYHVVVLGVRLGELDAMIGHQHQIIIHHAGEFPYSHFHGNGIVRNLHAPGEIAQGFGKPLAFASLFCYTVYRSVTAFEIIIQEVPL